MTIYEQLLQINAKLSPITHRGFEIRIEDETSMEFRLQIYQGDTHMNTVACKYFNVALPNAKKWIDDYLLERESCPKS